MVKLSILICSVTERAHSLDMLLDEFERQCKEYPDDVEVLVKVDNKVLTIGHKRQMLLEESNGEWIVYFDDDDWPSPNYVKLVLQAISNDGVDCIGIWGRMTTNGARPQTWCHRLGYEVADRRYGYDYIRPILHFNPVKRDKALQAGFNKEMRFGEDMDYAGRLNKLLTKEYFIEEPLFHYRYSTDLKHNEKYGIR